MQVSSALLFWKLNRYYATWWLTNIYFRLASCVLEEGSTVQGSALLWVGTAGCTCRVGVTLLTPGSGMRCSSGVPRWVQDSSTLQDGSASACGLSVAVCGVQDHQNQHFQTRFLTTLQLCQPRVWLRGAQLNFRNFIGLLIMAISPNVFLKSSLLSLSLLHLVLYTVATENNLFLFMTEHVL